MTKSTQTSYEPNPHPHVMLAEEVRAYLVTVRGGAPFLSAADGRLLVDWLDQGVPVAVVLSAIERTAHRRAGRRRRTRLTLRACKGEVKKLFKIGVAPTPASTDGAPSNSPDAKPIFGREADRIAALEIPPEATEARATLVQTLRNLGNGIEPTIDASTRAASAIRTFHEHLWAATSALQVELRQQATVALAPLEPVVNPKIFSDLVDEHVRQAVRNLVPGIEISPLWAQLNRGDSA